MSLNYYMSRERPGSAGEGMRFSGPDQVRAVFDSGALHFHAAINVRIDGQMVETTTGRILLREVVPEAPPDRR